MAASADSGADTSTLLWGLGVIFMLFGTIAGWLRLAINGKADKEALVPLKERIEHNEAAIETLRTEAREDRQEINGNINDMRRDLGNELRNLAGQLRRP